MDTVIDGQLCAYIVFQGWTLDNGIDEKSKAVIEKMLQEEQFPFHCPPCHCLLNSHHSHSFIVSRVITSLF